jgi:hypothetical protein
VRSSSRFSVVAAASIALEVICPAPARADDAELFFAQGRSLRAAGKCGEAIVAFRRALDVKPLGLGSLRNVAECEEQLGEFASARSDWWSLRRAVLVANEPKYEGWEKTAEEAYKRLEAKVARITIKLTGPGLDRVSVSVDGKPLDPRLVGAELERDLGPHTIEAAYGGAALVTEKRMLVTGARELVTLAIPAARPGEAGAAADPGAGKRAGGFVALGVGVLGGVGAAVAAVIRGSALSAIEKGCPGYATGMLCPASLKSDRDRGQTASTLVTAFSVVAAAGIVAGVPLIIVGVREAPAKPGAPTARVELVPIAGGGALHAGVRF